MRISDWSSDVCSSDLGLGIGLANLVAKINGAPNGYRLAATGDTDSGPLSADVVLLVAAGPLTSEVERARLAGIGFKGRPVQSAAGPVPGQRNASEPGHGGLVRVLTAAQHTRAAMNTPAPK